MQAIFRLRLLFIILMLAVTPSFAQPGDPGDPDAVPITGIEWLLAGGALLGVRNFFKNRKTKG